MYYYILLAILMFSAVNFHDDGLGISFEAIAYFSMDGYRQRSQKVME
jgi:hypothetical protein